MNKHDFIEHTHSRVKWKKADEITAKKLSLAINEGLKPVGFAKILIVIPVSFPLMFLVLVLKETPPLQFTIPVISICILILALLLIKYIQPYLFPLKKHNIWMFRAKCSHIVTQGTHSQYYFWVFNAGGEQIMLRIPYKESRISKEEYNASIIGKEYIFYKFSDKTGKPWRAITADKFDSINL